MEGVGEEDGGGIEIAVGDLVAVEEAEAFEYLEEDEFALEVSLVVGQGGFGNVSEVLVKVSGVEIDGLQKEGAISTRLTAHAMHS